MLGMVVSSTSEALVEAQITFVVSDVVAVFSLYGCGRSNVGFAICGCQPGTKKDTGSAIRPKNSRLVAPPGFMLHEAADFSALDVPIFYNLGSYDSPESPLSM